MPFSSGQIGIRSGNYQKKPFEIRELRITPSIKRCLRTFVDDSYRIEYELWQVDSSIREVADGQKTREAVAPVEPC